MQIQRQISSVVSRSGFLSKIARDMVRHAAVSEGVERWLNIHGGSSKAPSLVTRQLARDLYGDSEEALLFNVALILEIDRHMKA